jgi:hypothetical protein
MFDEEVSWLTVARNPWNGFKASVWRTIGLLLF